MITTTEQLCALYAAPGERALRKQLTQLDAHCQRFIALSPLCVLATGGGAVLRGFTAINVGERNAAFVINYLKTERIPIVSRDVLEIYPRKVCFLPASGKAMVKRLAATHNDAFLAQDRMAAQKAAPVLSAGGSVDLF